MTRPGDRLRGWAAAVFDADTMEHLIDPVIADLQSEYADASRAGLTWRRRWVRAVGYAAFLNVATRSLRVFVVLTFVLSALLELPALSNAKVSVARTLYLIPQALVVAVPMALTLTIAWASRSARQPLRAMIAAGAVCSVFVFVTLAWWVPSANQAFRVSVSSESGWLSSPPRGVHELTIGELRQQMKWTPAVDADRRELEFNYYMRWAFPCASLALTLLMVALRRRGVTRRSLLLAAPPIIFGYYVLMFAGRAYVMTGGALPSPVGVWIPNAITDRKSVV